MVEIYLFTLTLPPWENLCGCINVPRRASVPLPTSFQNIMKTNSSIRVETQITSNAGLNSIQQGLQCNTWAQRRSYLSTVARTTCAMVHHFSLRLVLFSLSSIRLFTRDIFARFDRKRRKGRLLFVCFLAFLLIHMMQKTLFARGERIPKFKSQCVLLNFNWSFSKQKLCFRRVATLPMKVVYFNAFGTGNAIYSSPAAPSRENWSLAPSSWFKILGVTKWLKRPIICL